MKNEDMTTADSTKSGRTLPEIIQGISTRLLEKTYRGIKHPACASENSTALWKLTRKITTNFNPIFQFPS